MIHLRLGGSTTVTALPARQEFQLRGGHLDGTAEGGGAVPTVFLSARLFARAIHFLAIDFLRHSIAQKIFNGQSGRLSFRTNQGAELLNVVISAFFSTSFDVDLRQAVSHSTNILLVDFSTSRQVKKNHVV